MTGVLRLLRSSRRGDSIALPAFCTCHCVWAVSATGRQFPEPNLPQPCTCVLLTNLQVYPFRQLPTEPHQHPTHLIQRSVHDPRIARPCGGWKAHLSFGFNSEVRLISPPLGFRTQAPDCHQFNIPRLPTGLHHILQFVAFLDSSYKALCTHPAQALCKHLAKALCSQTPIGRHIGFKDRRNYSGVV